MSIDQHQLDQIFRALSDRTRRDILMQLREQEQSVGQIASSFQVSLPAVSKHLGVLEQAGLIRRQKHGRQRICHVEPERLGNALEWLNFYITFWNDRLENLQHFLANKSANNNFEADHEN